MPKVFVVQHEHEWCNRDDVKFIGVYATHSDAQAAVDRLRIRSGFKDWPDGFSIDEYELGIDNWPEGFVTVVNILIPSRTSDGVYHAAGSVWHPGDLYEITDTENADDVKFNVGDVVRCTETAVPGHDDRVLVASNVVRDGE